MQKNTSGEEVEDSDTQSNGPLSATGSSITSRDKSIHFKQLVRTDNKNKWVRCVQVPFIPVKKVEYFIGRKGVS